MQKIIKFKADTSFLEGAFVKDVRVRGGAGSGRSRTGRSGYLTVVDYDWLDTYQLEHYWTMIGWMLTIRNITGL